MTSLQYLYVLSSRTGEPGRLTHSHPHMVTAVAPMLVAPTGHLSGCLRPHSDLDNKGEGHAPFRFGDVKSVGNSEQSYGLHNALHTKNVIMHQS